MRSKLAVQLQWTLLVLVGVMFSAQGKQDRIGLDVESRLQYSSNFAVTTAGPPDYYDFMYGSCLAITAPKSKPRPLCKNGTVKRMMGPPLNEAGFEIPTGGNLNTDITASFGSCWTQSVWAMPWASAGSAGNQEFFLIRFGTDAGGMAYVPFALGFQYNVGAGTFVPILSLSNNRTTLAAPAAFARPIAANESHLYTASFCSSNRIASLYVDDQLALRGQVPEMEADATTPTSLTLGSAEKGFPNCNQCLLAHVQGYKYALSLFEVASLYASRRSPQAPSIRTAQASYTVAVGQPLHIETIVSGNSSSPILARTVGERYNWQVVSVSNTFAACLYEMDVYDRANVTFTAFWPGDFTLRVVVSNGEVCRYAETVVTVVQIGASIDAGALPLTAASNSSALEIVLPLPDSNGTAVPLNGSLNASGFPPAVISLEILKALNYTTLVDSNPVPVQETVWEALYSAYAPFQFSLLPSLASEAGLAAPNTTSSSKIRSNPTPPERILRADSSSPSVAELVIRFVIDNGVNVTVLGNYTLRYALPVGSTGTPGSSGETASSAVLPADDSSSGDSSVWIVLGSAVGGGGVVVVVVLCCCCAVVAVCLLCCVCVLCVAVVAVLVAALAALAGVGASGAGATALVLRRSSRRARMQEERYRQMLLQIDERKELDMEEIRRRMEATDSFREIDMAELELGKKIGQGAYGSVYLGLWQDAPVAIKMLNLHDGLTEEALEEFRHEATLMAKVSHHPNVVHFVGAAVTADCLCLVTHFCKRGALSKVLEAERLPWSIKLGMARDAAAGLAFLHSQGIVHRDMAARNILVGENYECYISDFGYSRVLVSKEAEESSTTKSCVGPVRWMAPEAMRDRVYNRRTDCYSFAMVLYEIATDGCMPFFEEDNLLEISRKIVLENHRPAIPDECDSTVASLMADLWHENPKRRPSMKAAFRRLAEAAGNDGGGAAQLDMLDNRSEYSDSSASSSLRRSTSASSSYIPISLHLQEEDDDDPGHEDGDSNYSSLNPPPPSPLGKNPLGDSYTDFSSASTFH